MVSEDTQPAMTYPNKAEYVGWKFAAEREGMSVSEWMKCMVRAGQRKWEATAEPDVTNQDLRQQRNDLKRQLKAARTRVKKLEDQLHDTEREQVEQFIRDNPGVTRPEVIQYISDEVPSRVARHLDHLLGQGVERDGDGFEWVGRE
jgi:hypothetical protein